MIFNKKAALELSMSTVVILVLAMLMLGLGIVLVRTIFKTSTESVDTIDAKVQAQLASLFNDESADVVVMLGPDHTAKVKPDTASFGVAVGARTPDGGATTPERIKFKLSLDSSTTNNCLKIIGQSATQSLFITSLDTQLNADQTSSAGSFIRIQLKVPKGTAVCTQKVYVDATDTQTGQSIGRGFFIVEILKPSLFG